MIKGPKTNERSHPALIQKEAIELLELKDAYIRYTTSTEGEFQGPGQQAPQEESAPQQQDKDKKSSEQKDTPSTVKTSKNEQIEQISDRVNPMDAGEKETDPFNTGSNNSSERDRFERGYLRNPWG